MPNIKLSNIVIRMIHECVFTIVMSEFVKYERMFSIRLTLKLWIQGLFWECDVIKVNCDIWTNEILLEYFNWKNLKHSSNQSWSSNLFIYVATVVFVVPKYTHESVCMGWWENVFLWVSEIHIICEWLFYFWPQYCSIFYNCKEWILLWFYAHRVWLNLADKIIFLAAKCTSEFCIHQVKNGLSLVLITIVY